jgi:hypothetical protein
VGPIAGLDDAENRIFLSPPGLELRHLDLLARNFVYLYKYKRGLASRWGSRGRMRSPSLPFHSLVFSAPLSVTYHRLGDILHRHITATSYRLDDRSSIPGRGNNFSVSYNVKTDSGAHPAPSQWELATLPSGLK